MLCGRVFCMLVVRSARARPAAVMRCRRPGRPIAMQRPQAVLLDLDPAYAWQSRLQAAVDRVLAVPLLPRYVCPVERMAAAARSFTERLPFPALVFLGSGDYHYLTAVLLERVRVPFTLILVDRHGDDADTFWGPDFVSCGGWVRRARRWPWLRCVLHLGGEALPEPREVLAALPTPAVYVSIDKDVLRPDDACTGWGTGSLALPNLLRWLATVGCRLQVVGMDVCGEWTPRLPDWPDAEDRAAVARNERANLALLGLWRFIASHGRNPSVPEGRRTA